MKKIFLDDERFPPDPQEDWDIVRSVPEAIAWVENNEFPRFVSFDNDLGKDMDEGWRFAQWLIDRDLDSNTMPVDFDFYVHSQNSVAAAAISARLRRYMEYKKNV